MVDKNIQFKQGEDNLYPASKGDLIDIGGTPLTTTLATITSDVGTAKTDISTLTSGYEELLAINNESWQPATLINGFNAYTAGEMVGFKKKANTVYLCGTLKQGTNTKPFVLPEGYRPSQTIRTVYLTSVGAKYITIEPNGTVTLNEYTNTMSFASIDGISFAI